jgi:hypothetical protein
MVLKLNFICISRVCHVCDTPHQSHFLDLILLTIPSEGHKL